MPTVTRLVAADFTRVPWKNGRGTTLDLALGPTVDSEPAWRASLADITENAPFSAYPMIDRTFAIVTGPGLILDFADRGPVRVARDEVIDYPGEAAPGSRLIGGPVQAFNVLARRGVATGALTILEGARPHAASLDARTTLVLFVLEGGWSTTGVTAATGEALRVEGTGLVTFSAIAPGRAALATYRLA